MPGLRNPPFVYLDMNIYVSIAKREEKSDYTLAKIHNLWKNGITFPHSPAHAEEVSRKIKIGRDIEATKKALQLIKKYNNNLGYAPGYLRKEEAIEARNQFLLSAASDPSLYAAARIHQNVIDQLDAGLIPSSAHRTRLINQSFSDCLSLVDDHLDFNSFANHVETLFMGRRNAKSLEENFSRIGTSTEHHKTFEELHRELNLGPRRLSSIEPEKIFSDKRLIAFAQEEFKKNELDFDKIPSPRELEDSHHKKEEHIGIAMNVLEKAGYCQEDKNHEASLIGRMHDVTHAIYASAALYFVTDDRRLQKKSTATYSKLGIPTKVICRDDFLLLSMNETCPQPISIPNSGSPIACRNMD